MAEKFINAKCAADLMGITSQAVYKAISNQTLPAVKEMGDKKMEVRIPITHFQVFLKDEKQLLQDKLKRIEQAENTLRRL